MSGFGADLGVDDLPDWPSFCGVLWGFLPSLVGVFGAPPDDCLPAAGEGAMLLGLRELEAEEFRVLLRLEVGDNLLGVGGKE